LIKKQTDVLWSTSGKVIHRAIVDELFFESGKIEELVVMVRCGSTGQRSETEDMLFIAGLPRMSNVRRLGLCFLKLAGCLTKVDEIYQSA
jgi:hypothetical protein